MDIIGRDKADSKVGRDARKADVAMLLLLHPMVVQFDEEILATENVAVGSSAFDGPFEVVRLQGGIDLAGQAATESDQPLGVSGEQFLVDPRPVVKTIQVRGGNELNQIAITGLVLRQQSKNGKAEAPGVVDRSLCERGATLASQPTIGLIPARSASW